MNPEEQTPAPQPDQTPIAPPDSNITAMPTQPQSADALTTQPSTPKKPKRKVIVIMGIVLLLFIIGGVGYYIMKKNKTESSVQTTTQQSQNVKILSSEELLKKLNTDIPQKFSDIKIDNRGDGTGVFTYKLPSDAFAVGIGTKPGQFSAFMPTAGDALETLPQGLETMMRQILEGAGYSEDKTQPDSGTSKISKLITFTYKKDDARCKIGLWPGSSSPILVSCSTLTEVNTASKTLQPFYDSYKAAGKVDSNLVSLLSVSKLSDSKTAGYRIANIEVGVYVDSDGGAVATFYSKNSGSWVYFATSQMTLPCSEYNTPDLKAAYKSEPCQGPAPDYAATTVQ